MWLKQIKHNWKYKKFWSAAKNNQTLFILSLSFYVKLESLLQSFGLNITQLDWEAYRGKKE